MNATHLEDLPEAVPLRRVSPLWRVFAVLAVLMAVGLGAVIVFMSILVFRLREEIEDLASNDPSSFAKVAVVETKVIDADPEPADPAEAARLPYPVTEDLRKPLGQAEKTRTQPTPRDRFVNKSRQAWKVPRDHFISELSVSPDGAQLAYFQGADLVAGPLNSPRLVELEAQRRETQSNGTPARRDSTLYLTGAPLWSPDSRHVYFGDAGGRLMRYDVQNQTLENLPFRGYSPAPLPGAPERIVFVRAISGIKVEGPGAAPTADAKELAVGNLATKQATVVVPRGKALWHLLSASPDGKQLAAVSNQGLDETPGLQWRVCLVEMGSGKVQPLSPAAGMIGRPCWAPDGKALIYARSRQLALPDSWSGDDEESVVDLYEFDLRKRNETRLSRGGGSFSPSVAQDGSLLFLLRPSATQRAVGRTSLQQMTLAVARKFAAAEADPPVRDVAAWTALAQAVFEDAKVAADVDGAKLSPEVLARLAGSFSRLYKERFQDEAPANIARLNAMMREVSGLSVPHGERNRLALLLAVVQGEYLRRQHGASWHVVEGSPFQIGKSAANAPAESPFGYVANPFQQLAGSVGDGEGRDASLRWFSLEELLQVADGRPLVLTNDLAAGRAKVAERTDADLQRGTDLLTDGDPVDGEGVLLAMLKRDAERGNTYLTLIVAKLLLDHNRKPVLGRLMQDRCALNPGDARLYNYLGLALLDEQPRNAVNAFKKALRCDLRCGAAYLNLADAYKRTGDDSAARACLRRYLELMPGGTYAEDAARRLTELDATNP
ncbi:MAG: hypothetical protein K2R98_24980 [Gemmataceae bacterium]|nr:hypothetical protein [Gemmataceae bacterium]